MSHVSEYIIALLLPFAKLIKILESDECSFCYAYHLLDQAIELSNEIVSKVFTDLLDIQSDLIECIELRKSFRRDSLSSALY